MFHARSRGGDRLVPIELESVDHSEGLLMLQFDAGSTVGDIRAIDRGDIVPLCTRKGEL